MTKLISARTVGILIGVGLFLAPGLLSCSLPRVERNGDVGEVIPPAQVTAPGQTEAPLIGPTPQPPAPGTAPEVQAVQAGVVVRAQPLSPQVEVGDTVVVEIVVQDVTDLYAADVQLQFDPALFQAEDALPDQDGVQAEPGPLFTQVFPAVNAINNQDGQAQYAVTQVGPIESVSGTGVLARIVFRAQANGVGTFSFPQVKLSTRDAVEIPVTTQPGQVGVGQPPPATAMPTPTPVPGQPAPTQTPVTGVLATQTPVATAAVAPPPAPVLPPALIPTPGPTPVPLVTTMPPGAITGFCYRVGITDTLASIANHFGVNPRHLAAVNKLFSPDLIYAHRGLFIPNPWSGVYGPKVYIAKAGDKLDDVGFQCNLPTEFLGDVNHLSEDAVLQAGHVLIIPVPPPFPSKPPACCPPPPPPPCYKQGCY